MPYIPQSDRDELKTRRPKNAGELNYLLTLEMHKYFKNYQTINDITAAVNKFSTNQNGRRPPTEEENPFYVLMEKFCVANVHDNPNLSADAAVGAINCALMEFYRRVAGPYEDSKAILNGDVP